MQIFILARETFELFPQSLNSLRWNLKKAEKSAKLSDVHLLSEIVLRTGNRFALLDLPAPQIAD